MAGRALRAQGPGRVLAAAALSMISTFGMSLIPAAPAAAQVPTIAGGVEVSAPAPSIPPSTLPEVAPVDPVMEPVTLGPAERDGTGVREARDDKPLKLVAVTWTGAAPDLVELRSTDASGRFGTWTALDAAGSERDDVPAGRDVAGGTDPIWVGERTAVEVRATRAGASVTDEMTILRIDPGTSPNDAEIGRVGRAAAAPSYVTRAQWGADPRLATWQPEILPTVRAVTVHHTAESNDYGPGDSAAIVRGIFAYHARTQGWGDIGYNALVDKFGTIFEGRQGGMDKAVVAAHAGGFNRETWGIAMMGNHVSVPPTAAELESVARLAAWKLAGRDPYQTISLTSSGGGTSKYAKGRVAQVPTLFGHRDVGNTVCPGDAGYGALNGVRDRVRVLATGTTAPAATTTPAATATPAATRPPTQVYGPGEPVIREGPTVGNRGWYNLYARGAVYWTPTTGSWEVYGAIYSYWSARRWESSQWGYPTSNEYDIPGGRQQNFERGRLRWIAATGQVSSPA